MCPSELQVLVRDDLSDCDDRCARIDLTCGATCAERQVVPAFSARMGIAMRHSTHTAQ